MIDTSWIHYLPPVLQEGDTWFSMIVAFAAYGYFKSFPQTDKAPWIPQLLCWVSAEIIACVRDIGNSFAYSFGVGMICAWGASSFYELFFFWLTNKIRSALGRSPVGETSSPQTLTPGPKLGESPNEK